MGWFPTTREEADGWKFDIVSLVAVIGETTIERHVPPMASSLFGLIPRLIPAPQTLLQTERATRLPPVKDVIVMGVESGTKVEELNFFANIIHEDVNRLKPFEFRMYRISHNLEIGDEQGKTVVGSTPKRSNTLKSTKNEDDDDPKKSEIVIDQPFHPFGWMTLTTTISVLMTIGLFIWAACIHDGVALIAIATMSMSTSLGCLSNRWVPVLQARAIKSKVPPGDVVIRTRQGAFVVVHCDEEITRELYVAPDTCKYYLEGAAHRVVLGISTVLLMASIIFFSNCGWTMQTAIGIAYIILNMIYWAVPRVIEEKNTWDLSRYHVEYDGSSDKHCLLDEDRDHRNYTKTLWYAIRETGRTEWVETGHFAPKTKAWDKWLSKAQENIDNDNWDWDAVAYKNEVMGIRH
ncbi:hypothetical protein MW887_007171 [Aspergillus wentii]|nr:hypothetical protein MW887_007171 [Aspergillus wentii]